MKSGSMTYNGKWRITDDGHFCMRWQNLQNNVERCETVVQDGDAIRFVLPDGSVASTVFSMKQGNTENM